MKYHPYADYRQSAMARGATLPCHWSEGALKRSFDVTLGKMLESEVPAGGLSGGERRPYLRSASVQDGRLVLDHAKEMWFSSEEIEQLSLRRGDLVVCEGGDVGRCAVLEQDLPDLGFQNSVHRVRVREGARASTTFLYYWLKAVKASGLIDVICNKATIAHLTVDKLKNLRVPYPDLPDQEEIAEFLRHHTRLIDARIVEEEGLLRLLREKRQSLLFHAFTPQNKLEGDTQCGTLSCLGQAPLNWTATRLGYYATVENGCTPSKDKPEFWDEGSIPWVSSGEVNNYQITEPTAYITPKALEDSSLRLFPKNSILIGMIGQGRTRGMSAMLSIEAAINQNVAAVVPGESLLPRFLHYYFEAAYQALRDAARGGNQAALNCEIIRATKISFPGKDEQAELVKRLDASLEPLTQVGLEIRESIEQQRERKKALISAAVTGMIDVRGFSPAMQEAA